MPKKIPVQLVITGVDRISKMMARITNKFPKLSRQIRRTATMFKLLQQKTERFRKSLSRIGSKMKSIGATMTTRLTVPIGLAGAAILSTAVTFQKSMNRVGALTRTILGGVISPEFEKLKKRALELGSATEFSSTQAADAMGLLGRAGFSTAEILESTDDVLALASATGMDLAFTADIMAKTIRGFGLEADQAGRVADVLADVSRRTNVDLETLAQTFKEGAPIARAYGATLEQTAAITGLLGDVGIQGSKAGTTLKAIMLKLAAPTAKANAILKKLNITVSKGADGMNDIGAILSELAPALGKFPKQAQLAAINELFGLRGIAGASALMSRAIEQGKDPIETLTKVLEGSTGAAKDMQRTMLIGAPGALARMRSAFEGLGLAIADSGLLDFFTDIVSGLAKLFSKMSKISPVILKFAAIFAGLIATIGPVIGVLGFMVAGISSLITAFSAVSAAVVGAGGILAILVSPIALAIAGILALVAAVGFLIFKWDDLQEIFTKTAFGKVIVFIGFLIGAFGEAVLFIGKWIAGFIVFGVAIAALINPITATVAVVIALISGLVALIENFKEIKSFFGFGDVEKKIKFSGELGPAKGVANREKEIQTVRSEQIQKGLITLDFLHTPKGLRVRSEGPAISSLNMGMSGGPG